MDHEAGIVLSKVTHVYNGLASTEYNFPQQMAPPEDWEYYWFAEENGIEWRKVSPDQELYELVLVRDSKYERWRQAFFGKPKDVKEIPTNDLFVQHSSKPWLWKMAGRKDDMITYGNGWNFHPAAFQEIVESHPAVKGAIMVRVFTYTPLRRHSTSCDVDVTPVAIIS